MSIHQTKSYQLQDLDKPGFVFFGTGYVGQKSLETLSKSFYVESVITKKYSDNNPVVNWCTDNNIECHQISDKDELANLFSNKGFTSKFAVLIDFGVKIPKSIIDYFDMGIINSHFSLLPEWRGPDPISFSILSGQKTTGVTLMILSEEIDEGLVLASKKHNTSSTDTNIENLTDELIKISNNLIKDIVPEYLSNRIAAKKQTGNVSYSKKLLKSDGKINFNKKSTQIYREFRAFLGWPGSFFTIKGKKVNIIDMNLSDKELGSGKIQIDGQRIFVGCGDNLSIEIISLKPEGKSTISAKDFINGYLNNTKIVNAE